MDEPIKIQPSWRARYTEWLKAIAPGETFKFPSGCRKEHIYRTAFRLGMRVSVLRQLDGTYEVTRQKDEPKQDSWEQEL